MKPLSEQKDEIPSCSVENCGVSDQAFHGKSQRCDSDVKPFCAEVNGVSSLIGNHTGGKASKENCGAYNFTYDHADALVEDVKVAVARPGHAESAYPDGALTAKNGSCMAVDDLPQEFEREHAGATLDELFFSNDEEEDDSDWDPTSSLVVNRWFCLNCTMPNVDEITHCMVRLSFWWSGKQSD
jgi:histone deacetylase 6